MNPFRPLRRSGSGVGSGLARRSIKHVYVLSASILQRSLKLETQVSDTRDFIAQASGDPDNIPQIVTTYSVGGWDSEDYITALPSLLEDMQGLEDAIVLMHGFGNDITPNGPWPGGGVIFRDRMRDIIQQVQAAGHDVLLANVSYRIPPGSNPAAPYNVYLVEPIMRDMVPWCWDRSKREPVYDLYSLTMEDARQFFISDNVHPNDNGQHRIRALTGSVIGRYLSGEWAPARPEDFWGRRVVVSFGRENRVFNGINPAITNVVGSTVSGTLGSAYCVRMLAADGTPLNGPILDANFHANVNQSGRPTADSSTSIANGTLLGGGSIYTDIVFEDSPAYVRIRGLPNGLTGTLSITAARSGTGARVGLYSVNGSDTQQLDGVASPSQVITFPFTVVNGEIVLRYGCAPGNGFCYVNGIQIDFDANPINPTPS